MCSRDTARPRKPTERSSREVEDTHELVLSLEHGQRVYDRSSVALYRRGHLGEFEIVGTGENRSVRRSNKRDGYQVYKREQLLVPRVRVTGSKNEKRENEGDSCLVQTGIRNRPEMPIVSSQLMIRVRRPKGNQGSQGRRQRHQLSRQA